MFDREVPVYVFTGFLESGKTSFIADTFNQDYFNTGERTLLIVCEEGMIEYEDVEYAKRHIYIERVEREEELTPEYFEKCQSLHKPKRVLIEYNGMWKMEPIMEENFPANWVLAQIISTVDATTYDMYWGNMRSLMIEQLSLSDMIILNRCNAQTKRNDFRRNVKLFNKKAQIGFDFEEGFDGSELEEELPFDLDAPEIVIEDDDYGIWYMDAMENTNKYVGKTVKFNGVFFRPKGYPKNQFVPGRFAMTCCADDIAYMGMLCHTEEELPFKERDWISLTAEVKYEYVKEYGEMGPVLYLKEIAKSEKPEDDLVYF